MKRVLLVVLATIMLLSAMTGCKDNKPELKEEGEYFYSMGTYTSLDYDFANEFFAKNNDNWGGGCSAVSAVIDGERLVGRNMDLCISNKCAYVVKTDVPGKYETIGLAYTFRDFSPDYETVKKDGIDETFEKILPFLCDDVMNSEGLHIEINMRHGETDADGNDLFSVEHTNADAKERIYVFNLGQYVALNCKDIPAVKKYIAEAVDVYSQRNYWNYCFVITDAEGNSELLEFGNGKYYWTKPDENGVVAQTNFYINEECNKKEDIKSGLGRYDVLMSEIGKVKNKSELYELMKRIQYTSIYLPYDECKEKHFDPRSETIGEKNDLGIDATYDVVMNPENEELLRIILSVQGEYVNSLTRKELQELNFYWESTFTEVVNPKEKTIEVRLFENEDYLYRISFDGVEKINKI